MQIQKIQNNNPNTQNRNVSFGIKVSQNLISKAHNHFNYNQVANKRDSIFAFNKTVEKYANRFGYDNYTLDYEQSSLRGVRKHYLVATRDGSNGMNRIIVSKQNTLVGIIRTFLTLNAKDFDNIMKQGLKTKNPNI